MFYSRFPDYIFLMKTTYKIVDHISSYDLLKLILLQVGDKIRVRRNGVGVGVRCHWTFFKENINVSTKLNHLEVNPLESCPLLHALSCLVSCNCWDLLFFKFRTYLISYIYQTELVQHVFLCHTIFKNYI